MSEEDIKSAGPSMKTSKPSVAVSETAVAVEPEVQTTADASISMPDADLSDRSAYASEVERIRKMRKPFGSFTQKLALPVRPGYHRHWFNDIPGRVDEATQSGWTYVKDDKGRPIRRVVGRGPQYAYAMEIPSVFWEEDRAIEHARARAPVDQIKSSPFRAKPGQATSQDNEKFYSPREAALTVTKS